MIKLKNIALYAATLWLHTNYIYVLAQPQNLVPNHSFEDLTNGCPPDISHNFNGNVSNWYKGGIDSPEIYSMCNSFMNAPNTPVGIRMPKSGENLAAIFTVWGQNNFSNYIGVQLTQPLQLQKEYYFEMFISLTESSSIACHNIGVYFSQNMLWCNCNKITNIVPQIENTKQVLALDDRENWIKMTGTFVSQGGEEYITIGNYRDSTSVEQDTLSPISPWGLNYYSYHFIDDVFLYDYEEWQAWQDSLNNNPAPISPVEFKIPNAFSPNADGINDFFVIQGIEECPNNELFIYNRWGELVYYKTNYDNTWNGESNTKTPFGKKLTEGTYFYVFRTGKEGESYSGFIELRR